MRLRIIRWILLFLQPTLLLAADWSKQRVVPPGGVPNPFDVPTWDLPGAIRKGKLSFVFHPVPFTGAVFPVRPLQSFLEAPTSDPLALLLRQVLPFRSLSEFYSWAGMYPFPEPVPEEGPYSIPRREGEEVPDHPMGVTYLDRNDVKSLTFSCAACHTGSLFGRVVFGLTNQFPLVTEEVLNNNLWTARNLGSSAVGSILDATPREQVVMDDAYRRLRATGTVLPKVRGLQAATAVMANSIARRNLDEILSFNVSLEKTPRPIPESVRHSHTKAPPLWTLRFKNRFLLDGAIVSGNPIRAILTWTEVMRGTDLLRLEQWFEKNDELIREMTTAIFESTPPPITDFFPSKMFNINAAQRGEVHFNRLCARCHGQYNKVWSEAGSEGLPLKEQLKTRTVIPLQRTPVVDVGTDPDRYLATSFIAGPLNQLRLMKSASIEVEQQTGYVPPPLVGIWARWPFFHNNSAPSLCAVLTRGQSRPTRFYVGEAVDRWKDFDLGCNGYPLGAQTPRQWREKQKSLYDTRKRGQGNLGHDEGIFLRNGQELLSTREKMELISFLQTL